MTTSIRCTTTTASSRDGVPVGFAVVCMVLALGSYGCDSGQPSSDDDSQEAASDEQPSSEEQEDEKKRPPESVLESDAPTVPNEETEGLELGADRETVAETLPDELPESGTFEIPGGEDVERVEFRARLDPDVQEIDMVKMIITGSPTESAEDDALAFVTEQWGEPDAAYEGAVERKRCWFNPEKGIRACTSGAVGGDAGIALEPYVPLAQFLGEEGEEFAFENTPIIGASLEAIAGAYGDELEVLGSDGDQVDLDETAENGNFEEVATNATSIKLRFPPTEFGTDQTDVTLFFGDDGAVDRYVLQLPFSDELSDWRERALELFESKFGEPEMGEELGTEYRLYREEPRVKVERSGGGSGPNLVVTVGETG